MWNGNAVRRLAKISAYSVMSVLAVLLIAAAAIYFRLSQGPISLDFIRDTVESRINANLHGMSVTVGGIVLERAGSGVPHLRLRNIEMRDDAGNLIARAPRAAIGIDEAAVFSGAVVPRSLELIGPRIRVMRNIEGQIELGFGEAAPEGEAVPVEAPSAESTGKSDQEKIDLPADSAGGAASLFRILSGERSSSVDGGSINAIETIRVAEAEIRFFDEANDSVWRIPKADLVFQRMPYGFAVASNAEVSNGAQPGNWHADMSASYRRDTKSFSVSLRIADLVPANVSDEIFALSQLARVNVPLAS